jgi:hypothetical protein
MSLLDAVLFTGTPAKTSPFGFSVLVPEPAFRNQESLSCDMTIDLGDSSDGRIGVGEISERRPSLRPVIIVGL